MACRLVTLKKANRCSPRMSGSTARGGHVVLDYSGYSPPVDEDGAWMLQVLRDCVNRAGIREVHAHVAQFDGRESPSRRAGFWRLISSLVVTATRCRWPTTSTAWWSKQSPDSSCPVGSVWTGSEVRLCRYVTSSRGTIATSTPGLWHNAPIPCGGSLTAVDD